MIPNIPEYEFTLDFRRILCDLSERIARSGLTIPEIAQGTRLRWETVNNAANGQSIRLDSYFRILYFLDKYQSSNQTNKQ